MSQPRGAVIGGTRNDEDLRDSDQKSYCVHTHFDARRLFDKNYGPLIQKYEDQFQQLTLDMLTFFESKKQVSKRSCLIQINFLKSQLNFSNIKKRIIFKS